MMYQEGDNILVFTDNCQSLSETYEKLDQTRLQFLKLVGPNKIQQIL